MAFCNALEVHESAVKILGDDTLLMIAREMVEAVRRNPYPSISKRGHDNRGVVAVGIRASSTSGSGSPVAPHLSAEGVDEIRNDAQREPRDQHDDAYREQPNPYGHGFSHPIAGCLQLGNVVSPSSEYLLAPPASDDQENRIDDKAESRHATSAG